MPLYNLACRQPLPEATRRKVAAAITEAHCRETGAPAEFVNVIFLDGYPLPAPRNISVLGGVRTGGNRTPEIIGRLEAALRAGVAEAAEQAPEAVAVSLIGVPSSWIVEGGEVMPAPGEESAWLERKHGSGAA